MYIINIRRPCVFSPTQKKKKKKRKEKKRKEKVEKVRMMEQKPRYI
jgi:hypothetical protein